MKITFPNTTFPAAIKNTGQKDKVVSGITVSESGGAKALEISFTGLFSELTDFQNDSCCIGTTVLPENVTATGDLVENGWICEGSVLRLQQGGLAELVTRWRLRNERETAEECAAGLLSRTISVRRIERQETIEHYAARSGGGEEDGATGSEGTGTNGFSETFFNLWRQEADPVARAEFKVRVPTVDALGGVTYSDPAPLYSEDSSSDAVSTKLTKMVAERWAQGVTYASEFFVRVEVQEVWWKAPADVKLKCNVILEKGIPENHKPMWKPDDVNNLYYWMREGTDVMHDPSGVYRVNTAYIGMGKNFKPVPVPTGWGSTPFDEMLYEKEGSDSGGGTT